MENIFDGSRISIDFGNLFSSKNYQIKDKN